MTLKTKRTVDNGDNSDAKPAPHNLLSTHRHGHSVHHKHTPAHPTLSHTSRSSGDKPEAPFKHGVILAFSPSTTHSPDSLTPLFASCANIRISQVRLWLVPGKDAKPIVATDTQAHRALLSLSITHLGRETILDSLGKPFPFTHDPVLVNFTYDTLGVKLLQDCRVKRAFGREAFGGGWMGEEDSGQVGRGAVAPLGVWGSWRFEIWSGENWSLDLEGVEEAGVEWEGMSRPYQR
jgi:hypothetical protein